ncbi:MAG: segregation and condensation protein segregation and condensation protein [Candidatus Parcubacteria bacterium]
MFAIKLAQFEGPLDLLLTLIEQEKLDISQMSLATVTDRYLVHLQENPQIPTEELADFLVIATRLLYIKSKLLLPFLNLGDEVEPGSLESQLRIYKEYLDATKVIDGMLSKKRFLFVHEKLPQVEIGFAPPKVFTGDQMSLIMQAVIARLEPLVKTPTAVVEKTVSIHERIRHIQHLFTSAKRMSFSKILMTAESRTDIIVSFLALLELVKQRNVSVSQDKRWGDIVIDKMENAPEMDTSVITAI